MQWMVYSLLISNIVFLSIIICIQKLCGLSISDQAPSMLSEWEMRSPYHIPALSAGNLRHVDHSTSFWIILLDFLIFPHPTPSPGFPWRTISNCKYLSPVHQVWAESYTVGLMDKCSMTVSIQTDSCWEQTAPSVTHLTSVTWILFIFFVTNIAFVFSLNGDWLAEIGLIGRLKTWFWF